MGHNRTARVVCFLCGLLGGGLWFHVLQSLSVCKRLNNRTVWYVRQYRSVKIMPIRYYKGSLMKKLGERLRTEREQLRLTQGEISNKLGVSPKTQGLYERGERSPSAEYLQEAAQLGIDVNYIITGQRCGEPANQLTAQEEALIALYRGAEQPIQAAVMGALATGIMPERSSRTVTVSASNSKAAGNNITEN